MKKLYCSVIAIGALLALASCKSGKKADQIKVVEAEAIVTDSVGLNDTLKTVFIENLEKYPRDFDLLNNKDFVLRMKQLCGTEYVDIVKHFDTQTPLVETEGIIKFSGGKVHAVPEYQTTVFYDTLKNVLNVVVSRNGQEQLFVEKNDTIHVPEALKSE